MKVVNSSHSHSAEIIQIYFYDEQHQIISIGKNGVILIWDTHEMKILQTFKDGSGFRYSMFDPVGKGILYTTNQNIKQYHSKIDPEIELKALQVKTMSKDYTNHKTFFRKLSSKKSLKDKNSQLKEVKNCNVLVTENSSLVFVAFLDSHNLILTVDSKNLVRLWDLITGESHSSYSIEIPGQATAVNIDINNGLIAIGNDKGDVKI